jgi:hypothetical protein
MSPAGKSAVVRHEIINRSQVDAEFIYQSLRELAESHGFVTDHADELLAEVATSIEEYDDYITTNIDKYTLDDVRGS